MRRDPWNSVASGAAPRAAALIALALLAACSGSSDGKNGTTALITSAPEPAGANCAGGGTVVRGGLDRNGNGTLEASEVTSTAYICNGTDGSSGQDGTSWLVAVDTELAGGNCSAGGIAVRSGPDTSRDGVLQTEETTSTQYVCNGEDGTDGLDPIIAVSDLPVGSEECPAGGKSITFGLDSNRNGTLEDPEIVPNGTTYVCNGQDAAQWLVALDPAAAGCPAGGVTVRAGPDTSRDGTLELAETISTQTVCNGTDGLDSLVTLASVAVGSPQCPYGGTSVNHGLDANRNGSLDAGEIAGTTTYVCNGAPGEQGPAGTPGANSVVVVTSEPAGANCAAGGSRIVTFLDVNGNGLLDPEETANTEYVCSLGARVYSFVNAPWGGACPRGGVRIDSFVDLNGNGALDGDEVADAPQYVCNVHVQQMAAGGDQTCAAMSNGTIRCTGFDGVTNAPIGVTVAGIDGALAVASGLSHACALLSDQTVACWGSNFSGQLGVPLDTTASATPVPVQGLANVLAIQASGDHTCALRDAAGTLTVTCWGDNPGGVLGVDPGIASLSEIPVDVLGFQAGFSPTLVTVGAQHACATDGADVYCWGANDLGQLGVDPSLTPFGYSNVPVAVSLTNPLSEPAAIAAGGDFTCSVAQADGSVTCWGSTMQGRLGFSDDVNPFSVDGGVLAIDAGASAIAAGLDHACAVLDGAVWCWGGNDFGQAGVGTFTFAEPPAVVPGVSGVASLTLGMYYGCALSDDASAMCWGYNQNGQLGNGTTEDAASPSPVVSSLAP